MLKKEIHFRINELHQNGKVVLFYPEIKIVTKFSKGRWKLLFESHISDVYKDISKYYNHDSIILHKNLNLDLTDLDYLIQWSFYGKSTYSTAIKIIDKYIMTELIRSDFTMVESVHRVFEYNKISKSYVEKDNKDNKDNEDK